MKIVKAWNGIWILKIDNEPIKDRVSATCWM